MERLIRNWVIRPTDLIYDQDQQIWNPIGEHPLFIELFQTLMASEAETVVTSSPTESARGHDTYLGGPVLHRPDGAQKKPQAPARPQPPVPSPEVEGVVSDLDEITMMTSRTLELLGAELDPPEQAQSVDSEEKTELIERPIFDDEEDEQDLVRPRGRHGLPEDVFATAELPGPVDDKAERLDELAELDDADPALLQETVQAPRVEQPSAQAPHIDDEMPPRGEELLQEEALEETLELAPNVNSKGIQKEETEDEARAIDANDQNLRETLEMDPLSREAILNAHHAPAEPEQDGSEQAETEELEFDSDALDLAMSDLEMAAIAAQEADDDEDILDIFVPVDAFATPRVDMTAQAYEMELPFKIVPSEEAQEAGIHPTTHSKEEQDALFTPPYPKESGTFLSVTYDLRGSASTADSDPEPEPPPEELESSAPPAINPTIALILGAATLLLLILLMVFL